MDFITITENAAFNNPILGEGVLEKGKTYFAYTEFAQETARQGLAQVLEGQPLDVVHFRPSHLHEENRPRKILLLFTGGFGDAVTVASVLPVAMEKHRITFDMCCASAKWHAVFQPMGFSGRYVGYPPDLETLSRYDAIVTDITEFYHSKQGVVSSPLVRLSRGLGVPADEVKPRYKIPPHVAETWKLPPTGGVRIGVTLDSKGLMRSYPRELQEALFDGLRRLGGEIFVFGAKKSGNDHAPTEGLQDLRGATSIPELAAVLQQMDMVIGVDSFPVHLANVFEVPTFVLLSTTPPEYFDWHQNIDCLSSGIECSPCFEDFDLCPKGHEACLAFYHESIKPEIILQKVIKRLSLSFLQKLSFPCWKHEAAVRHEGSR